MDPETSVAARKDGVPSERVWVIRRVLYTFDLRTQLALYTQSLSSSDYYGSITWQLKSLLRRHDEVNTAMET